MHSDVLGEIALLITAKSGLVVVAVRFVEDVLDFDLEPLCEVLCHRLNRICLLVIEELQQ